MIGRGILVCLCVLAAAVVGCGGGAASGGELDVWAWGTEGELLEELTPRFEAAHPGLKINVTSIPTEAAHEKLLTAIAGNQTPDVAMLGTTWMAEFAQTGTLDPVPATIDRAQFFPGASATAMVDGTAYGVPWYVETRVLYYRTDIARRAGITAPPRTWDELKTMARALQGGGRARYGIHLGTSNWLEFLPFVWQAGGEVLELDSPAATEAMGFYKSFIDEGLAPDTERVGFQIAPAFVRGTHPMFFSGPWQMGLIREAAGREFDAKWAVAPVPARRTGTSFVGGANWSVFKASRIRDAAWTFVQWLSQPSTQAAWFEISSDLPANRAAWALPALTRDPRVRVFGEQLTRAKSPAPTPHWERIAHAIDTQLDRLLRSRASGPEAARQLARSARAAAD